MADTKKGTSKKKPPKAPHALSVIVLVVNKRKNDFYVDLLQENEVNICLTTLGEGTYKGNIITGLENIDMEKSVIFGIVRQDREKDILALLNDKFNNVRGGKGVAFSIPLSSVIGVPSYKFLANKEK